MRRSIRRNAKRCSDSILKIIDEIKQAGVTAEELTKAKKISLSHHLGSLTTMRGQASDLGSNWFLTRNLNFSRDYLEAVQKVTLEDIRRVAQHYLTSENLTIVSLNPKGSLARQEQKRAKADFGRRNSKIRALERTAASRS